MKRVQYLGPGDEFDARPIPGFGDDPKFVFYSPTAEYDGDGNPVPAEKRGNVVSVTNDQWIELYTRGGAQFVEVEQSAAVTPKQTPAAAEQE